MRTAKRLADTLAVLLVAVSAAASQQYGLTIEHNVEAKMRDVVILRADIYRPKSDEKFPVLLQRTPYDKAGAADEARDLAAHGYIVVIQDVRGRFASDGDFYPVKNEAANGFDTVEWAATLPGSNGKVGIGSSYIGITQFQDETQEFFLALVDVFTVTHIEILRLFRNRATFPQERFRALDANRNLTDPIVLDLNARGLLNDPRPFVARTREPVHSLSLIHGICPTLEFAS